MHDKTKGWWRSWMNIRNAFNLKSFEMSIIEEIWNSYLIAQLPNLSIPQGIKWQCVWTWSNAKPFKTFSASHVYKLLQPDLELVRCLNHIWDTKCTEVVWRRRFQRLWCAPFEPKRAFLWWPILHNGLIIKARLAKLGHMDTSCIFCGHPKIIKHLFQSCLLAKPAWNYIQIFVRPIVENSCSWNVTLLRDTGPFSQAFYQTQGILRTKILAILQKIKNNVFFYNKSPPTQLPYEIFLAILSSCGLQINAQAQKVQVELSHLLELINHWGTIPCPMS